MNNIDLSNRIVLVTGATRGIGWYASLALAKAGAHIIAIGRTQGALEELDDAIKSEGGKATLVPMDLTNFESIDILAQQIIKRWGKLDGLLGNAAMLGDITPTPQIEHDVWDKAMALNATANLRLIQAFDGALRASDAGRAVFMSTSLTQNHRAYWGAYAASKAAMDAIVTCYANETTKTNLRVNLLDPSAMRTAMRAKAVPGEDPEKLPHPSMISPLIVKMLSPSYTKTAGRVRFRETDYFMANKN